MFEEILINESIDPSRCQHREEGKSMEGEDEVYSNVIDISRRLSSSNTILRRASNPRILLDGADIRLSEQVVSARKGEPVFEEDLDGPEIEPEREDFVFSDGISASDAALLLKKHGKNEIPKKDVNPWVSFLQLLLQPIPIMIWIAVIIQGNNINHSMPF